MSEITGIVESVTESKSGKSLRVKIADKWFGANKDSGLRVGCAVKATYSVGDFGPWIEEWSVSAQPTVQAAPQATNSGQSPYQPLVSNLAAHLIAADKDPGDLAKWVRACRAVLEEREPGFDDEIPY